MLVETRDVRGRSLQTGRDRLRGGVGDPCVVACVETGRRMHVPGSHAWNILCMLRADGCGVQWVSDRVGWERGALAGGGEKTG